MYKPLKVSVKLDRSTLPKNEERVLVRYSDDEDDVVATFYYEDWDDCFFSEDNGKWHDAWDVLSWESL